MLKLSLTYLIKKKGENMCFTKSAPSIQMQPKDTVVRHEANAELTKNSKTSSAFQGFRENIKTSAFGLEEQARTQKKTLLGE